MNYSGAQRYVEHLEAAGIVREISEWARNRVYRADAVMAAVEGPLPDTVA